MNFKDEKGIAFPLVLIIVLVLTVLGTTLYLFSTTETRQVLLDENKMKAHYIARSGAHAVALHLVENPDIAYDLSEAGVSEPVDFAGGYYRVEVVDKSDSVEERYRVISAGTVNNVTQKIDVTVSNVGVNTPLYANVFNLSGSGGEGIRGGDVIYGGGELDDNTRSTMESLLVDGEIRERFVEMDPVVLPCDDPVLDMFGPCPEMQSFYDDYDPRDDVVIDDDIYYEIVEIANQGSLHIEPDPGEHVLLKADLIDIGNTDTIIRLSGNSIVAVVADEIVNRGHVYVQAGDDEGGFFLLYVKDYNKGLGDGNRVFNVEDGASINLYVLKDGTLNLRGTPNFEGSIYAPEAKSVLTGTASIVGWIIANEAQGQGGMDIQFSNIRTLQTLMDFDFYEMQEWRYVD